jgi:hypothetical protein
MRADGSGGTILLAAGEQELPVGKFPSISLSFPFYGINDNEEREVSLRGKVPFTERRQERCVCMSHKL